MAMQVMMLEKSDCGTAKVKISVGLPDGRTKPITVFSKFCRREEAVGYLQEFFDNNPCLDSEQVYAVFEPIYDVAYIEKR